MIQSDHNVAHVTTAELSWHVQNCDLIGWLFCKQEHHISLQDLDCELISCHQMGPSLQAASGNRIKELHSLWCHLSNFKTNLIEVMDLTINVWLPDTIPGLFSTSHSFILLNSTIRSKAVWFMVVLLSWASPRDLHMDPCLGHRHTVANAQVSGRWLHKALHQHQTA